jgi:hypothetical protein
MDVRPESPLDGVISATFSADNVMIEFPQFRNRAPVMAAALCALFVDYGNAQAADTATGPALIEVTVTGVGTTAAEAENDALTSAVRQAVGAYIDNETLIKNEQLVYDKVLSASNGFVKDYKVLVPVHKRVGSSLVEVRIKATVQKGQVGAALRAAGVAEVAVEGTNIWADARSRLKSQEDAEALIFNVIAKVSESIVELSVVNDKPITTRDTNTGRPRYLYYVDVKTKLDLWFAEAVPALKAALDIVAMKKGEQIVDFLPAHLDAPEPWPSTRDRRFYPPGGYQPQSYATDGKLVVPTYSAVTRKWEHFVFEKDSRTQGSLDGRHFLTSDPVPGIFEPQVVYVNSPEALPMGLDFTFPVRMSKTGNQCTFAGYKLPENLWSRIVGAIFTGTDMHGNLAETEYKLQFQLLDSQNQVVNEQSVRSPFYLFFLKGHALQMGGAALLFHDNGFMMHPYRSYGKRIGYLVELPADEYKEVAKLRVKWGSVVKVRDSQ